MLLIFLLFVVSSHYNNEKVKQMYSNGYALLDEQTIVKIQNQYKCCGRDYYNETVCIDQNCFSSAVLDKCVKQFYFKDLQVDGGCVPHLIRNFQSRAVPCVVLHAILFCVFILNNIGFLVYFLSAGSLVDYSLMKSKSA